LQGVQAVEREECVNFYVDSLKHVASPDRTWLIYRGSFDRCVGIFADSAEATRKAIGMAEYCVARGQKAQVHERPGSNSPWHTVWHAPGTVPRFL
jgi:hypothetical protein